MGGFQPGWWEQVLFLALSRHWAPCPLIVWIVLPQLYAHIDQYSPEYLRGSSADFQILSPCNFALSRTLFCKLLLRWSPQTFNFVFSTPESIRLHLGILFLHSGLNTLSWYNLGQLQGSPHFLCVFCVCLFVVSQGSLLFIAQCPIGT